jgi:foldase protein PrsA
MYEKADELNASISTEDKEKYSIGVQKIQEIMEENLLAQKLYLSVTDGVGEDISEDDVRVANIEYIKVMTHDTDKNGTAIDLSDADEDAAYKKMQGYKKKIDKGFDFLQLARMSSDSADVKASIYKGYSGLSEGVVNAAMDLKKGEISQIIEDDTGFYLIRCSNNYDEDLSAERKNQMAEELKEESFKKAYGEWSKDVEVMLNDEFWSDFNIVSGDV